MKRIWRLLSIANVVPAEELWAKCCGNSSLGITVDIERGIAFPEMG
jgi:hypothetical protein